MKNLLFKFLAITMIVGFSANVMAQSDVDSDALATLIIPISIANSVPMDFKTLGASDIAGTVVMTAASSAVLSATGGVTVISGTPTAGEFTVTGEGTQAFTITLPSDAATLSGSVSGDLTVDNWTCSEPLTTAALSGGTLVFYVGGTLNVGAEAVAGTYTGTFNVSVDYN